MNSFIIFYRVPDFWYDGDLTFCCRAKDRDDAKEQCIKANPKATIKGIGIIEILDDRFETLQK